MGSIYVIKYIFYNDFVDFGKSVRLGVGWPDYILNLSWAVYVISLYIECGCAMLPLIEQSVVARALSLMHTLHVLPCHQLGVVLRKPNL